VTPAEAIEAAELSEAETAYRLQFARETAAAAYERGLGDGYVRAIEDVKALQHGMVRDAEIEAARWGAGGREHFADPRPGDFLGKREPEPELERELEVGL
jgi:hypothetical protein